jgi:mannobiose 2-epimerase
VRASGSLLRRLLEENILPFWYPQAVDQEFGGYLVHHDSRGRWKGPAPKHLVVQARALWFFSSLARAGYHARYLEAASSGFGFLRDRLWDREKGGFYWSVDHEGRVPVTPDKRASGRPFGLFAAAEYAAVSGERRLARPRAAWGTESVPRPRSGGYFCAAHGSACSVEGRRA